jgi:hypothetical protein
LAFVGRRRRVVAEGDAGCVADAFGCVAEGDAAGVSDKLWNTPASWRLPAATKLFIINSTLPGGGGHAAHGEMATFYAECKNKTNHGNTNFKIN